MYFNFPTNYQGMTSTHQELYTILSHPHLFRHSRALLTSAGLQLSTDVIANCITTVDAVLLLLQQCNTNEGAFHQENAMK